MVKLEIVQKCIIILNAPKSFECKDNGHFDFINFEIRKTIIIAQLKRTNETNDFSFVIETPFSLQI